MLICCLFYLSILSDNLQWHARVGSFNAVRIKSKKKSNNSSFLLIILYLILIYTFTKHLNLAQCLITHFSSKALQNCKNHFTLLFKTKILKLTYILVLFVFFHSNIFLICTPDIETNSEFCSFCQWNMNGLTSHKLVKISLLHRCITHHKHGVIYVF